jgi:hypothetical protein
MPLRRGFLRKLPGVSFAFGLADVESPAGAGEFSERLVEGMLAVGVAGDGVADEDGVHKEMVSMIKPRAIVAQKRSFLLFLAPSRCSSPVLM